MNETPGADIDVRTESSAPDGWARSRQGVLGHQDSHGEMTWRRADGSIGEYVGPLTNLGFGVPRDVPDHGIRRAIFDIAFGYVSGFPLRDILAYIPQSLVRGPIRTAYAEEVTADA